MEKHAQVMRGEEGLLWLQRLEEGRRPEVSGEAQAVHGVLEGPVTFSLLRNVFGGVFGEGGEGFKLGGEL